MTEVSAAVCLFQRVVHLFYLQVIKTLLHAHVITAVTLCVRWSVSP